MLFVGRNLCFAPPVFIAQSGLPTRHTGVGTGRSAIHLRPLQFLHLPHHLVVLPAFAADVVVINRTQEVQQPDLGHPEGRRFHDRFEPPLGAPAADRVAVVAGNVADLLQGQHIGRLGQLLGQAAAQLFAAGTGQVQAADQSVFRRLVVGVVLVPAAGRGVAGRVGGAAAQVVGHVRLGDPIAAGALAGVVAGHQAALQQVDGRPGADVAGLAEIGAGHGVWIGGQGGRDLFFQLSCALLGRACHDCVLLFGMDIVKLPSPENDCELYKTEYFVN